MSTRKAASFYQYPYPAEPRSWTEEERAYGRGLKRLFDILFSRKLQNVLIEDKAVNSRTIDDGAIHLHHLREGLGADLDIAGNESITTLGTAASNAQRTADGAATAASTAQQTAATAQQTASTAQQTADGLTNKLMPVGITVITPTSPSYGTWSQTEVGGMTAWTRTA